MRKWERPFRNFLGLSWLSWWGSILCARTVDGILKMTLGSRSWGEGRHNVWWAHSLGAVQSWLLSSSPNSLQDLWGLQAPLSANMPSVHSIHGDSWGGVSPAYVFHTVWNLSSLVIDLDWIWDNSRSCIVSSLPDKITVRLCIVWCLSPTNCTSSLKHSSELVLFVFFVLVL